jgi:lysine 2,3-aminomutase
MQVAARRTRVSVDGQAVLRRAGSKNLPLIEDHHHMPDGAHRTPEALISAGLLSDADRDAATRVAARYAVGVSGAFAALIGGADDPIGRQVLPHADELRVGAHERADPVGDEAHSPLPGLVHRYPDRVLIKPLLVCPVYCRFCFRREHVGPGGGLLTEAQTAAAVAYVRARPAVREVILTGGDPLLLSPRRLGGLLGALGAIGHVEMLRIHTRVPVADPGLVTEALAGVLETETPLWLVLHANHAREFSPAAVACLRRIQAAGVSLLGQSVLLRGVNDSEAALEDLFRAMLRARVKPYYLHHLDPAPGTARFHVPIAEGQALLAGLRGRVTGLAWPTYVLDIPGGHGKVPIGPVYLDGDGGVRDPWGGVHALAAPGASV